MVDESLIGQLIGASFFQEALSLGNVDFSPASHLQTATPWTIRGGARGAYRGVWWERVVDWVVDCCLTTLKISSIENGISPLSLCDDFLNPIDLLKRERGRG